MTHQQHMNTNTCFKPATTSVWIVLFLIAAISSSVQAATANALQARNLDVILVMDSSGSMKKTDPQDLRKPAAKLFVSLLGKNDRASIVSFSDNGYPVAFLTDVKAKGSQEKLFSSIDKISTKGVSTNLQGAIDGALRVIKRAGKSDRKKIIILMTDGKMDLGDDAQSRQLTEQLLTDTLPALEQKHIEVHTIAFTKQSDQSLLKKIAEKTSGTFNISNTDKELHDVYTAIFEQNKAPNMLPFDGEKFSIDKAIREVTIVGSKDSEDSVLSLLTPDGRMLTAEDADKNIKWFVSQLFDLITIKRPGSGQWQIKSSTGKNKAYVITDLKQKLEITPRKPAINEGILIKTWLEDEGKIINKPSVLATLNTELNVVTPDKQTHKLAMEPEVTEEGIVTNSGIYTSLIALPETGKYSMRVIAHAQTFSREKSSVISVLSAVTQARGKPEPVDVKPTEKAPVMTEVPHNTPQSTDTKQPAPEEKLALAATEAPDAQTSITEKTATEQLAANESSDSGPETKNPDEQNEESLKTDKNQQENKKTNSGSDKKNKKKSSKSKKDKKSKNRKKGNKDEGKSNDNHEDPETGKKKEGTSIVTAILVFLGINVLLGGIGAGIYFYLKKRNRGDDEDEVDEDNEEEEARDKAA